MGLLSDTRFTKHEILIAIGGLLLIRTVIQQLFGQSATLIPSICGIILLFVARFAYSYYTRQDEHVVMDMTGSLTPTEVTTDNKQFRKSRRGKIMSHLSYEEIRSQVREEAAELRERLWTDGFASTTPSSTRRRRSANQTNDLTDHHSFEAAANPQRRNHVVQSVNGRKVYHGRSSARLQRIHEQIGAKSHRRRSQSSDDSRSESSARQQQTDSNSSFDKEISPQSVLMKRTPAALTAMTPDELNTKLEDEAAWRTHLSGAHSVPHQSTATSSGGVQNEVTAWLDSLQLAEYADLFTAEAIDSLSLLERMATDSDSLRRCLDEIGVRRVGHRERIVQALQQRISLSKKDA